MLKLDGHPADFREQEVMVLTWWRHHPYSHRERSHCHEDPKEVWQEAIQCLRAYGKRERPIS